MQENREFQDISCEAISSSSLQNNIKNLIMNYCCHGEFFYATWSKISFFPQRHTDGREGFKIKQRDFSLICPEKKHPTQTLSWCYHSCHGDRIRHHRRREEIGLLAFHCGAKHRDGRWIETCCYRRELTEGVSVLCCGPALISSQMPRREAENKAISWCLMLLCNSN